ncbi:hypothetical protein GCM10027341_12440 [Spirosoma knui]
MESPKEITAKILYQKGLEVFQSTEAYNDWLNSYIPNLGGCKPSHLIHSESGRRRCHHVLNAILWGTFFREKNQKTRTNG